jgi:hypothetical protein
MAKHELTALESQFRIVYEKPAIELILHLIKTVKIRPSVSGKRRPISYTKRPREGVPQCCEIIEHARNLFDRRNIL